MSNELISKIKIQNEKRILIFDYEKKIRILQEEIKNEERIIFKICKHIWINDNDCCSYEKTRYICKTCNLYKNSYWYE
jgi:hypothetical protein